MDATLRPAISSYFARLQVQRGIALGLDEEELLRSARLDRDLLDNRGTRITPAQLGALMRKVWRELDDELSGYGAEPHRFGTFALMARHTTHCTSLREALGYAIHFYNLMSRSLSWQLHEQGDEVEILIQVSREEPSHFVEEFMLLVWHRYFNWLIGTRMPLLRTNFSFPRPAHAGEHLLMFPGPIQYGQPHCGLFISRRHLEQPVVRSRQDLRQYLQRLPDEWFIKQEFENSLADRIYHTLMDAEAGSLPEMRELASTWSTTTRTMHRHLEAEQSSFRQIRDQVRRDKAIYYLLEDRCTVGEIARRLAMTEPAFSRAFKIWTGLTPLAYRRSREAQPL